MLLYSSMLDNALLVSMMSNVSNTSSAESSVSKGVAMKPGMACCYAEKNGKLIIGLSGNPASSLINLYAICMPALLKLNGRKDFERKEFDVLTKAEFKKASKATRFIRGKLDNRKFVA